MASENPFKPAPTFFLGSRDLVQHFLIFQPSRMFQDNLLCLQISSVPKKPSFILEKNGIKKH